ncbi:MAG: DedA family protein [candidate division Zixibacteria bacterium]|nr:DedA family protein [candidate division Zixibacteria bacterium]
MTFDSVVFFLTSQAAIYVYAVILISAIIENLFPPFPGDVVVLAGAFLAGRGDIGYIPLFLMSITGGMLGAMILYYLGRRRGRMLFEKYDKYYLRMENLRKIENWFRRWGVWLLLFSRFVAGARSVIALTAGVGNVPVKRMTVFTLISFCLWNFVLIGGMFLLKSNWAKLTHLIKSYNLVLVIASAVVLLIWLAIVYKRSIGKV